MPDEFEREKLCYAQNCEQMRCLNTQMNSIPSLAMILTGGLWFGAGVTENIDPVIRFGLLLFASICDFCLLLVCIRTRDVLESYFEKIKAFHPNGFADGSPDAPKLGNLGKYSMITLYAGLMALAGILSLIGAFFFFWPFCFSSSASIAIAIFIIFSLFWLLRLEKNR